MVTDFAYTERYYGCTTQDLSMRMAEHRRQFKNYVGGTEKFDSVFILFNIYLIYYILYIKY